MVTELKPRTEWRGPGCSDACQLRMVILPGLIGRHSLELHDPETHERYGRELAGDPSARGIVETGPLTFSRNEMRIWVQGREISLTATEWRIFLVLIDRVGRFVHKHVLLDIVWGPEYDGEDHLLRVNMARLRDRLGDAAGLMETVTGMGYRLLQLPSGEIPPELQRPLVLTRKDRWAIRWARCRGCLKTDSPHSSHGYCNRCVKRLKRTGGVVRFGGEVPDGRGDGR